MAVVSPGRAVRARLAFAAALPTQTRSAGKKVGAIAGVVAIAAGANHSLVMRDTSVWAWGAKANGQLGNNSTTVAGAGGDGLGPRGSHRLRLPEEQVIRPLPRASSCRETRSRH